MGHSAGPLSPKLLREEQHENNKTLNALGNHYEELQGVRIRELEKPMEKIEDLELGDLKEIKEV